ncbi:hypothetical protein LY474_30610 [Myxococcus stipitatus]|uniref:ArnT family glycosyltransferase n=1 Tax=Myxococcus stipitatus TaxID=83455 RepID=UPI001F32986A|nr:hypothetical protein [Myxococcus stipitatus]MCE9672168.1 hypothetical protein [Myxococcus stipitatus]
MLIASGAWLLRIAGFFHRGGALGHPVDYDEGVYFSAAALLSHGVLPYRDYFFVHPPGIAVLLAPVAALARGFDAALAFTVARWLIPGLGALSTFLCGRIAQEQWGLRAGVVAALAYAVFPEAAAAERGPFLEAFLNLSCLGMAWVWLRKGAEDSRWKGDLLAGVLLATACAIKLTAGAWVIAAVWARGMAGQGRRVLRVLLVAAAVGLAWLGPFFVLAPSAMFDGLLRFQLLRPPDGELGAWSRLLMILGDGRVGLSVLCVWGLVVALSRTRRREAVAERLFAAALVLTLATFLSSKSYWTQYNAHLAPTMAVLAGLGASVLLHWADTRSRTRFAFIAATVMLIVLSPLPSAIRSANQRDRFLLALGSELRASVPKDSALCTFEPAWAIAAGRLPGIPEGTPVLVDPYGLMLNDALTSPATFASAGAAFEDAHSQRTILPLLARCDGLVLEGRGEWQLSPASERWVQEHFVREGAFWRRTAE